MANKDLPSVAKSKKKTVATTEKNTATTRRRKKQTTVGSEMLYRRNAETGELEELPATVIDEEWDETVDVGWDKIWLSSVMEALEQVGNKKIKVANYILSSRDKTTNYLIKTQRDIAKECNVSLQTVSSTLKALEAADLLVGKAGIYQINPDRIAYGKNKKRMAILRLYRQNKSDKDKTTNE